MSAGIKYSAASDIQTGGYVLLASSVPSSVKQEKSQDSMFQTMNTKKINLVVIDGAAAENKDLRESMWKVSNKRAVYPQVLKKTSDGFQHIGDYDELTEALEYGEFEEKFA